MLMSSRTPENRNNSNELSGNFVLSPALKLYFRTLAESMTTPTELNSKSEKNKPNFRDLLDQVKIAPVLKPNEKRLRVGNDGKLRALDTSSLSTFPEGKGLPLEMNREIPTSEVVAAVAQYVKKLAAAINDSTPLADVIEFQKSLAEMKLYLANPKNHENGLFDSQNAKTLITATNLFYEELKERRTELENESQEMLTTAVAKNAADDVEGVPTKVISGTIFERKNRLQKLWPYLKVAVTTTLLGGIVGPSLTAAASPDRHTNLYPNSITGQVSFSGVFPELQPNPATGDGDYKPLTPRTPGPVASEPDLNQNNDNAHFVAWKPGEYPNADKAPAEVSKEVQPITANFQVESLPISASTSLNTRTGAIMSMQHLDAGQMVQYDAKGNPIILPDDVHKMDGVTVVQYGGPNGDPTISPNFTIYTEFGTTPNFGRPGIDNFSRDISDMVKLAAFLNQAAGEKVAVPCVDRVVNIATCVAIVKKFPLTINGVSMTFPEGSRFYGGHDGKGKISIPNTTITNLDIFPNSDNLPLIAPILNADLLQSLEKVLPVGQKVITLANGYTIALSNLADDPMGLILVGFNKKGEIVSIYPKGYKIPNSTNSSSPTLAPTPELAKPMEPTPIPPTGYDTTKWFPQTELSKVELVKRDEKLIAGVQTTLEDQGGQKSLTITFEGMPKGSSIPGYDFSKICILADLVAELKNLGYPMNTATEEVRFVFVSDEKQIESLAQTLQVKLDKNNGFNLRSGGYGVRYAFSPIGKDNNNYLDVIFVNPKYIAESVIADRTGFPLPFMDAVAVNLSTQMVVALNDRQDLIANPNRVWTSKSITINEAVGNLQAGYPHQLFQMRKN